MLNFTSLDGLSYNGLQLYTDHMVCGWIEARRRMEIYMNHTKGYIDWFLAKAWDYWKIKGGLVGFLTGVVEWILRGFKYHRKLIRWISRDLWTI